MGSVLTTSIILSISILFWASCVSYPLQIFPEFFRNIFVLNPFYYFFDLIRIIWLTGVDPSLAFNYFNPFHIIIVGVFSITLPIIAVYLFNTIYKKFGISGY